MKMPSKSIYASLTLVFTFALAVPANARDGQAWGGQCITNTAKGIIAVACGDGASCSGNGRGGSDCTFSIKAEPAHKTEGRETVTQRTVIPKANGGLAPVIPVAPVR